MAYDRKPLYLTFGGDIGTVSGGVDIWQFGLHVCRNASWANDDLPTDVELTTAFAAAQEYVADATSGISAGAVLKWAKAVVLKLDGSYDSEPVTHEGTATPGGAAGGTDGPQSSLCVTLYSGQSLGRGNYGRYYLPWCVYPTQLTTGTIHDTNQNNARLLALTFLSNINNWAKLTFAPDARICIQSKLGTGITKTATSLRVGNVKDTQRRRRNRIPEGYLSVALPL